MDSMFEGEKQEGRKQIKLNRQYYRRKIQKSQYMSVYATSLVTKDSRVRSQVKNPA